MAADIILNRVAEDDIDLVVLTSHGHAGVERFVLGHVAGKVMRSAPCPVLTVKYFGSAR